MCAKKSGARDTNSALTADDILKFVGLVFAIVGASTTFLYIRISSAETALNKRIDDKFGELKSSLDQNTSKLGQIDENIDAIESDVTSGFELTMFRLGRIEQALGVPPLPTPTASPEEASLWVPISADAQPLSTYSIENSIWEGVWVELSDGLGERLGFRNTFFSPLATPADLAEYTGLGFNYVATFLSETDPNAEAVYTVLLQQGWQKVSIETCVGPSGYDLLVSPALAELAVAIEISHMPSDLCDSWRTTLESYTPDP